MRSFNDFMSSSDSSTLLDELTTAINEKACTIARQQSNLDAHFILEYLFALFSKQSLSFKKRKSQINALDKKTIRNQLLNITCQWLQNKIFSLDKPGKPLTQAQKKRTDQANRIRKTLRHELFPDEFKPDNDNNRFTINNSSLYCQGLPRNFIKLNASLHDCQYDPSVYCQRLERALNKIDDTLYDKLVKTIQQGEIAMSRVDNNSSQNPYYYNTQNVLARERHQMN